jgi:hypothetical protein
MNDENGLVWLVKAWLLRVARHRLAMCQPDSHVIMMMMMMMMMMVVGGVVKAMLVEWLIMAEECAADAAADD